MSLATITPQALAELCKNGKQVDLVDVRTPVEYREVHVEIARNVPLNQLDAAALMRARNRSSNEPLYVICRSGSRGRQACEMFLKAGFSNVINVEGGTMACADAGLPVVRGKKAISLERQVRIAAGSLVLMGALLYSSIRPSLGCRHSWEPAWCSPESPTLVVWACCWRGCRGIRSRKLPARAAAIRRLAHETTHHRWCPSMIEPVLSPGR